MPQGTVFGTRCSFTLGFGCTSYMTDSEQKLGTQERDCSWRFLNKIKNNFSSLAHLFGVHQPRFQLRLFPVAADVVKSLPSNIALEASFTLPWLSNSGWERGHSWMEAWFLISAPSKMDENSKKESPESRALKETKHDKTTRRKTGKTRKTYERHHKKD